MKESASLVPVLAFKRANLVWRPGGAFSIMSNASNQPIELDADAACESHLYYSPNADPEPCEVPNPRCHCGFHAVKDVTRLTVGYGLIRLDVELSGRVIVHEHGYRAAHQRVLKVHKPECWVCGEPSVGVAISGEERRADLRPYCSTHESDFPTMRTPLAVVARRVQADLPLDW